MGLVQMSRDVVWFESELTSVDLQNNPNPAVKRPMPFKWIAKEKRIHLLLHKNWHQLDIFKIWIFPVEEFLNHLPPLSITIRCNTPHFSPDWVQEELSFPDRSDRTWSHPRAAAGWCCLCWSRPLPSSNWLLLTSLPGVQHGWPAALQGQPGPTQLAPMRFRELGSDWSRPDPALWLVQANLSSNWQKWALGLSARLPTPPRLFANQNVRGISETMEKYQPQETILGLLCSTSWDVLGFWRVSRLFVQFWVFVWRSEASLEWPPRLELGPRENSRTEASRLAIGRTKFTRPLSDFGHTESGSIQICSLEPIGSGWKQRSMIAAYENLECKNGQRKHKSRFWSGRNNQIDKDQDRKMTGRPPRQILPKGGKNKIQPLKTCSKAYFQFYHPRAPQRSSTWSTTAMVALQILVN